MRARRRNGTISTPTFPVQPHSSLLKLHRYLTNAQVVARLMHRHDDLSFSPIGKAGSSQILSHRPPKSMSHDDNAKRGTSSTKAAQARCFKMLEHDVLVRPRLAAHRLCMSCMACVMHTFALDSASLDAIMCRSTVTTKSPCAWRCTVSHQESLAILLIFLIAQARRANEVDAPWHGPRARADINDGREHLN